MAVSQPMQHAFGDLKVLVPSCLLQVVKNWEQERPWSEATMHG